MIATPGATTVAPLLLELARAVRAREAYPGDHPSRRESLVHTTRLWLEAMRSFEEIEILVEREGLALPDGIRLSGPGLDELRGELERRGARRLRFHRQLAAGELGSLVVLLARDRSQPDPEADLERALRGAGVSHITTSTLPFAAIAIVDEDDDDIAIELLDVDGDSATTLVSETPLVREPDAATDSVTVRLVRMLGELEQAVSVEAYRELARKVEALGLELLAEKNTVDSYRAGLAFCRHASDPAERDAAVRIEAQDCLRRLFEDDLMLRFVIEHTCAPEGMGSVQALQILLCLGAPVVPRIIQAYMEASPEDRPRLSQVLITMGDAAFPAIVEELGSPWPSRVRRAARLLGDIQHPRAVEFLGDQRTHADPVVRREVLRALARIRGERAVELLAEALQEEPETAEMAATALGLVRSARAHEALAEIASDETQPEHVRCEAVRSLGRNGHEGALEVLERLLTRRRGWTRRRQTQVRVAAVHALGRLASPRALALLREQCEANDAAVREAARDILRMLGDREAPTL
jgi:hypothetical protein